MRLGIAVRGAETIEGALAAIVADKTAPLVLIGGSLYLAGEALAANGTPPV